MRIHLLRRIYLIIVFLSWFFSSVVLFHDFGSIESITYKNMGQEKGGSSKTINVKACRMAAWPYAHTLIGTQIHIKQNKKTHKKDPKKKCLCTRGGVEDTARLEAKAKDTKKIRGQGQPFRGQTLSRPRTGMLEANAMDQGHSRKCSPKKKVFKKVKQSPIYRRSQNFWLGRPKPQITCNDVIKNLPGGT